MTAVRARGAADGPFVIGAFVVREMAPLRDYPANVLAHAREGSVER